MKPGRSNRTPRGGMSIRTRMVLSMLAAAALIVPVVILSLLYIRRMNDAVNRVVTEDIELMRIGDRISLDFARARRGEKNFLLYRDSTYLTQVHEALADVHDLSDRGRKLEPKLTREFNAIVALTDIYRDLADSLIRMPVPETRGSFVIPSLSRLRRTHEELLRAAASVTDSLQRDSILAEAARLGGNISLPLVGSRTLNDSIESLQLAIAVRTDSIVAHARTKVEQNRRHARMLAAWGQRNIITVLLVVLVVLVWLLVVLPRRAVLPIKRITNSLLRTEEGELNVRVKLDSRDELGQLARRLNRSFARLREFDNRKADRILQLERRFRLLLNDISEGVIIVNRIPNVVIANPAMESLLGCPASEAAGKELRGFARLAFVLEPLERVLAGSTSQQTCNILPEMPGSAVCIEALRDKAGDLTGALIVITHPHPPETPAPAEADSTGL